jgi:hypothetical protein
MHAVQQATPIILGGGGGGGVNFKLSVKKMLTYNECENGVFVTLLNYV